MSILKIENRTENWKTACVFAPLFRDAEGRNRLAERLLGKPAKSEVSLELFWFGARDYVHAQGGRTPIIEADFAKRYGSLFEELHDWVKGFVSLASWQLLDHNYTSRDEVKLTNNLIHTEIDIVLQSQRHLFIGEAKRKESFGENRELVLVHQLVRQYVMARILLDIVGSKKQIVPFVVGNDREKLANDPQVEFMAEHLGMRRDNVLRWDDVRSIAGA